jgi:hypothetical protein
MVKKKDDDEDDGNDDKPSKSRKISLGVSRKAGPRTGFQLGADMLKLNVDALVTIYDKTINITNSMMKGGKANTLLAYFGTLIYTDLLHGGAYAIPIDQRPYYQGQIVGGRFVGGGTKYDPQNVSNLPSSGILGWLTQLFAGSGANPAALFDEVLIDSNCPHIFPKLLSDEAYGLTKLGLAYAAGTDMFKTASTGLATLVEAESSLISASGEAFKDVFGTGAANPKLSSLLSLLAAGA